MDVPEIPQSFTISNLAAVAQPGIYDESNRLADEKYGIESDDGGDPPGTVYRYPDGREVMYLGGDRNPKNYELLNNAE